VTELLPNSYLRLPTPEARKRRKRWPCWFLRKHKHFCTHKTPCAFAMIHEIKVTYQNAWNNLDGKDLFLTLIFSWNSQNWWEARHCNSCQFSMLPRHSWAHAENPRSFPRHFALFHEMNAVHEMRNITANTAKWLTPSLETKSNPSDSTIERLFTCKRVSGSAKHRVSLTKDRVRLCGYKRFCTKQSNLPR
jgi:hypothetical protein